MAYFLGRLDGHAPGLDLEQLIKAETNRMTAADFREEARRCDDEFASKGRQLAKIGHDLVEHENL
jgi:hypothetical protein